MFRLIVIFLVSLILSSCATYTPVSTKPEVKRTWKERQQILSRIDHFQLAGKIAFHSPNDAGSATLNWKENRGQYTVSLFGPLGSNSVKIMGQKGNVTLENTNGQRTHASTPEALVNKELGYRLPVSYLKYWIRGIAVPNLSNQPKLDNYQRLVQLQQAGWNVKFLSYGNVDNIDLPTRIQFSSADLEAKIIVYNWQLKE